MLDIFRIDESEGGPLPDPAYVIGSARTQARASDRPDEPEIRVLFFDADAFTRPHIHAGDQILHFLLGTGFVAFPGEERQPMPEGSMVIIPAGSLHMHGATDAGPISQLSILMPGPSNWDPPVPDEWRQFKI